LSITSPAKCLPFRFGMPHGYCQTIQRYSVRKESSVYIPPTPCTHNCCMPPMLLVLNTLLPRELYSILSSYVNTRGGKKKCRNKQNKMKKEKSLHRNDLCATTCFIISKADYQLEYQSSAGSVFARLGGAGGGGAEVRSCALAGPVGPSSLSSSSSSTAVPMTME
jgi:hypothetical protein